MQYQNSKTRFSRALTLVEMVIAMAIMAIVFAAILPQFRVIQNSWDSKQAAAETIQNSRVLMEHLYRNFSKAVKITAVSDSSETNGYIEFEDNDANSVRYDINGATSYVEFGPVGDLADLAGPVSQFQFTCYDACDLDTPIMAVADIRCVKVETTLTNPGPGLDKTFTTQVYLRANYQEGSLDWLLSDAFSLEYDTGSGKEPALCKIDATHYLCAYEGPGSDGWAVILTVDTSNWTITSEPAFEFDTKKGKAPALWQIDATHYLCAYQGDGDDGWAVVLTVNTGNWTITKQTSFEFDVKDGRTPSLCQIDATHYLCAYEGDNSDGWVNILKVDTGNWTISEEDHFEFDQKKGKTPALAQIDQTHYLCAYQGDGDDGWAAVLTVSEPLFDAISMETPFEFDNNKGIGPALVKLDSTHYLCAYQGDGDDGWAVVLTVNTGNWTISKGTAFEYDNSKGEVPALAQIDDDHFLCAYQGDGDDGWAVVLTANTANWTISKETPFEFDTQKGKFPALSKIDDTHYLCAYQGDKDDGWVCILNLSPPVLP